MLQFLYEAKVPHILVYTKVDKLNRTQRGALEAQLEENHPAPAALATLLFSSETKEGRDALWERDLPHMWYLICLQKCFECCRTAVEWSLYDT